MKTLIISPPKIIPWLSMEEKENSIVLLDFEVDGLDDGALRFDLNVVFNSIPVKRGLIQKVDYYIGSSGAEVAINFDHGIIKDYSGEQILSVDYSNSVTHRRNSNITIKPNFSRKGNQEEVKVGLGAISLGRGLEKTFSCSFECTERILSTINMENFLRWIVTLPRGEKAVRDYLIGNLYLYVKCFSKNSNLNGTIKVRLSDIRFFDDERRPLSKKKSLVMLYTIWKQGIHIQNKNGFEVDFNVKKV
ncbi:hypothetical protein JW979_12515 [bacterium]|nr:hypothetical protein [candidate division CSSED10-310 bacterium]